MKTLSLLIIGLVLFSCVSYDKKELNNLNQNQLLRIGHGGSGFASFVPFNPYPANSLSSIKKAILEDGAEGVEVDVHMTSDHKFVLYHDRLLDSKTNQTGCIEQTPYHEIVSLDYKLGFPYDLFQSEKIIGLEALIDFCKTLEVFPYIHIDLRAHSECFSYEQNLVQEKDLYHHLVSRLEELEVPQEKVLIISLRRSFLMYANEQQCPYPLSFEEYGTFEEGLTFAQENNIKYLTLKSTKLSKEKAKLAHQKGIYIITFGANSKLGNKRLLELNPDIIQTNNLNALHDLLR